MAKAVAAVVLLCWGSGGAFAADPILGWWRTQTEDRQYGHVEVYPCGAVICGTVRRGFDDQDREGTSPIVGREIMTQVQLTGAGTYSGRVYRPKDDKTYDVTLTVSATRLEIKGCAVGGLFCQTSVWARLP